MRSTELVRVFASLGFALIASACAGGPWVEGPAPPRLAEIERIEVRGAHFRDSGPRVITERGWIASIAESPMLVAGQWELRGPLPADPLYVIELWGPRELLATYTSSPTSCLGLSCPGWIGVERPGSPPLMRRAGDGGYFFFVNALLGYNTAERVRFRAASILETKPTEVDYAKPLLAQGADELDVVEIVMAVEDEFDVEIPDAAIADQQGSLHGLSVERLADVVRALEKTE